MLDVVQFEDFGSFSLTFINEGILEKYRTKPSKKCDYKNAELLGYSDRKVESTNILNEQKTNFYIG